MDNSTNWDNFSAFLHDYFFKNTFKYTTFFFAGFSQLSQGSDYFLHH